MILSEPPPNLPQPLPRIFDNTQNSYKFFWFLALLKLLNEKRDFKIEVVDLLIEMVVMVWYPVNYFRLSFGRMDQLGNVVKVVREVTGLDENASPGEIRDALNQHFPNPKIGKPLLELGRYVPTRFLRPWFAAELRGMKDHLVSKSIIALAEEKFHEPSHFPLYHFIDQSIFLNHHWTDYLLSHLKILQEFCYWNLVLFLQKRNPNVPNLSGKLFKPESRNLNPARKFWREVSALQPVHCIYSNVRIDPTSFSIDHFLPWSYVIHDQKWNLAPTTKSVNSAKSNCLPDLDLYLPDFIELHRNAYQVLYRPGANHKPLEDYAIFLQLSIPEIAVLTREGFEKAYTQNLTPQFQIAENMGFIPHWKFSD